MNFDRIHLSNFKPYGDADLRLTEGVTVIHGLNGSGKSSLLEACFFALYGSKALAGTLDDVVTKGEEETEVELWFTHDGRSYRIERRLRVYDDRIDHQCTLESTDGSDVSRDGARAVREFVTELLRMDAEAFVGCAYVRQGEVNELIDATPRERQDTIDDLLQLGKLEEYRERAGDARLGVEDVLENRRGRLDQLDEQIEAKEERDLHERLNGLESDLTEVTDEIDRYEDQRERAKETREAAAETLETHAEKREELESVKTAIGDRLDDAGLDAADEEAIAARREELDDRETEIRDELDDERVSAEAFRNQATNLAGKADDLAERAAELDAAADDLADEAEAAADEADERESSIEELREEAEGLRERFATADVDRDGVADDREAVRERRGEVRERIAELSAELKNARERVEEAEALLAAGKCPECGQPVEDSPHATGIDEDRERVDELESDLEAAREREADLDDRIEGLDGLAAAADRLGEIDETVEMLEERVAEKREEAETNREAAAEKREAAEETREVAEEKREAAEAAADRVAELEDALAEIDDAREAVDAVEERTAAIADAEDEIERRREKRETLAELNDERRDRLADKRERRDELAAAVDEAAVEEARERKAEAEEYLERVDGELDRLAERRTELENAIGGVNGEIRELENLRSEREELTATVEALEGLHEETSDLEAMYGDLRAELRQRNVAELERTLNETFDLVYGNDAYSHIELDGEYALTVYQKDGEALDPEQLSGGERALFNLSLRCAIYRLLSEGIEGAAPTPPLILDEPTVFLDSGHVSRLVRLVEEMRGFGVEQILIVSHDDELVGAADELVTVEKEPRSNRSTVRRADAAELDLASLADD